MTDKVETKDKITTEGEESKKDGDNEKKEEKETPISVLTFDREETLLRGHIPLDKFKKKLTQIDPDNVTKIDFVGNGGFNDTVVNILLKEKKKDYINLSEINLQGCGQLTDTGIKWLKELVQGASKLTQVNFDGCSLLSDAALSYIDSATQPLSRISMNATSVVYLDRLFGKSVDCKGCPKLSGKRDEQVEMKSGHVIIVPHNSLRNSLADYLKQKKEVHRDSSMHYGTDVTMSGWNMIVSEMPLEHPMFDVMVDNPVQVIIPFDGSADIQEVTKHVIDTVERVVAKAKVSPQYPVYKKIEMVEIEDEKKFMDVNLVVLQKLSEDGMLRNFTGVEGNENIGCLYSRQPFTRSNSYFEVKSMEAPTDSSKGGVIIGALFDNLFGLRNPMDSSDNIGGEVHSFECVEGDVYGFGIETEWESEYIPGDKKHFYVTKNSERVDSDQLNQNSGLKFNCCYPIISLIGDSVGMVQILNLREPPVKLKEQWREENKWMTKEFAQNILVDKDGVISYSGTGTEHGFFIGGIPLDNERSEVTVKILDVGATTEVDVGIGPQDYKFPTGTKSIYFFGKDGKVIDDAGKIKGDMQVKDPKKLENGDEITIQVHIDDFEKKKSTITFMKNQEVLGQFPYDFLWNEAGSLTHLYVYMKSKGAKAQIKNFQPEHRSPAPYNDKLTVGRAQVLKVFDDGTLECGTLLTTKLLYGTFISKVPFNAKLLYFEMRILGGDINKKAIGLCDAHYLPTVFLGKAAGTIGYNSLGEISYKTSEKSENLTGCAKFSENDVIGCGIEGAGPSQLEFDGDGNLVPQQVVTVYFTINGRREKVVQFLFQSDGLFPCICLEKEGGRVKLLNFYPETKDVWELVTQEKRELLKKEEKKKKVEEEKKLTIPPYIGCEFIVTGLGTNAEDKTIQIHQRLDDLSDKITGSKKISQHLQDMEKDFEHMDFQKQEVYSQLYGLKEEFDCLIQNPDRMHYLSADMLTGKGFDTFAQKVVEIQEKHKNHQQQRYLLKKTVPPYMNTIMEKLNTEKILYGTAENFELIKEMCDDVFQEILKLLHQQGKLMLIKIGSQNVVADIPFILETANKLEKISAMGMAGRLTMAIGDSSHVWLTSALQKTVTHIAGAEKGPLVYRVMKHYFGLIKLPCFRTVPTDEQHIYTTLSALSTPPKSLREYWKKDVDVDKLSLKDFVVIHCTYSFPHILPDNLLGLILAAATRYGRTLLLTSEGAAIQLGAVQTVIIRHEGHVENGVITVESKCYMPKKKKEPIDDLTEVYVEEYTWQIFCIYTDVVDSVLKQQGLVPVISRNVPKDLVNVSVGCKHRWVGADLKHAQSICTLCNECIDKGSECEYNGIVGYYLRECRCKSCKGGCKDCGICTKCAAELWEIRSTLRPNIMTCVSSPQNILVSSLDPISYNEVEFTYLSGGIPSICLKEVENGTLIKVFPGEAVTITEEGEKKIEDKLNTLANGTYDPKYRFGNTTRDTIKLKLSDPLGSVSDEINVKEGKQIVKESRVVYHTKTCREVRICHETGIICYDTASNSIPVGQFHGPKPFSKDLSSFSFEIISIGEKCTLAAGICPPTYPANRQPGWNRFSIALHGDDGGIFIESGFPKKNVDVRFKNGDIIMVKLTVDDRMLSFHVNDKMVHELKVNIPNGGYYPIIGFHSQGETVRLLEKDPWIPLSTETELTIFKPIAFDTYRYGNLFISPAKTIVMKKFGSKGYRSWLLLHNPSKDKIGYEIDTEMDLSSNDNTTGCLGPNQNLVLWMRPKVDDAGSIANDILVRWVGLEKSKEYSTEEVKSFFNTATPQSIHTHRMTAVSLLGGDLETLAKVSSGKPKESAYCLHIYKNSSLIEEYWIKPGRYRLDLPGSKGEYIIKYPKCPTYLYSGVLEKHQKVVVSVDSENTLAEALITESYDGGGYCLEYTPASGSGENEKLCYDMSSVGIKESDWTEDAKVLLYKQEEKNALRHTFVPVPTYLLQEGSKKALEYIDQDWMANTLITFSRCNSVVTRVTVQEQQLTLLSRTLTKWLEGYGMNNYVDGAFAFLPQKLDLDTLMYPLVTSMFSDVSVHRLCFMADQVTHFMVSRNVPDLRIPIHFMDIAGMKPDKEVPVDLSYGCLFSGWVYIALLAYKMNLPAYDNLFTTKIEKMDRPKIESLMYKLLQPYASLINIYAAQQGGLDFQINPYDGSRKVEALIKNEDKSCVKFKGQPITDPHVLIKHIRVRCCKAHHIAINANTSTYPADLTIKYEYFEPYAETVNAFAWDLPQLPSLPDELFLKLPNLQYFSLDRCHLKEHTVFPNGLSTCKTMKTIHLENLGVTSLPADLLNAPWLESVQCKKLLVKQLDLDWPTESFVTKLALTGLLITEVPAGICQLKELQELNLDYNPIRDLPADLKLLTKLRILSIKGVPLIGLEGTKSIMTKDQYWAWHNENPYLCNILSHAEVERLFSKYDLNVNGDLEEGEIARLNLYTFFTVPRIGSNNMNDEEYGGFPPVIFEMRSLEELYMNFQGISMVPHHISKLQNLRVLGLNHCPLLEALAGSVGHMPNIKNIRLISCPSLRTPPNEVVSRGFDAIRAYLKRLAGGYTVCRRTKLMFVGLGGAGKTSLLQALTSVNKKTVGTQNAQLTDGIEIKPWKVKADNDHDITYSTWDFAGQTVYYNTHQFFLSNRAVYMLLWNMRMGFEHAGLDFWLSSVACHAPDTPILVVGTQADQVPKPEIPEKDLKARYPQIAGFHYVSAIDGTGIEELEKQLIQVTLQQKYMGEQVPRVWLELEKRILSERANCSILEWDTVKKFAIECGIYDDKDVKVAVKFLGDLGTLQYFDNDFLRDKVVINPQWIVNVMACVVSVKSSLIQDNKGRFPHDKLSVVWDKYNSDLHTWLRQLTEEFDLTFPLPKDPINIVPCLLPEEEPTELKWPDVKRRRGFRENKMVYKFGYLPAGLFNRAQVRLFQFSDGKLIWKRGSMLQKNNHLALIRQSNDSELVVLVQGPRPENVLLLVHEVFESLIEESFHGVTYDFFIPCPDCISVEGTKEPCLFKAKLVRHAKSLKAQFLQCTKYFHEVSLGVLLGMLPEDTKNTDFDVHLQQSLSALQEINSAMAQDVAILYCKENLVQSKDGVVVNPKRIRDDIRKAGFSCWCQEDMDKIGDRDLSVAIKNCKLLVVCVSNEFEKDAKCRDTFIYAKDCLNKPFHIAVVSPDKQWEGTDLGMKIGQPKMAKFKSQDRYDVKIKELITMVQDSISGINKDLAVPPECFISYCWKNSRRNAAEGTATEESCLGWGDPRDIKDYLEKHGVTCWLDKEQMGKYQLYQDITVGLQNSKVMVVCVSDEYVESDACMMEARFGITSVKLPFVVAVVGTGRKWKQSEISLLMKRSHSGVDKVYFQQENQGAYDTLLKFIKEAITTYNLKQPITGEHEIPQEDVILELETKDTHNLSFQEEFELIQRKFVRHISKLTSKIDLQAIPRIIVFDFVKTVVSSKDMVDLQDNSPLHSRPKSASKSSRSRTISMDKMKPVSLQQLEENEDWEEEDFCIRIMCEHEEGWHLTHKSLSLRTFISDEVFAFLEEAAPFLARIYAILKQSSIPLNCLSGIKGDKFRAWIKEKGKDTSKFLKAYLSLHRIVTEHDEMEEFIANLDRCYLPSGKIAWLCKEHQQGKRITRLDVGQGTAYGGGVTTVFKEDLLFKEYLEEHPLYKKYKNAKQEADVQKILNSAMVVTRVKSAANTAKAKTPTPSETDSETSGQTSRSRTESRPESETKIDTHSKEVKARTGMRPAGKVAGLVSGHPLPRRTSKKGTKGSQACSIQ